MAVIKCKTILRLRFPSKAEKLPQLQTYPGVCTKAGDARRCKDSCHFR